MNVNFEEIRTTRRLVHGMLLLVSVLLLVSCGSATSSPSSSRTIKAVIKSTALSSGSSSIAGIQLSITVPTGVTPPLKADGSVDAAAAVEITSTSPGNQALPGATFTPATATAPAEFAIYAIEAAGFTATDTITIHLNIAPGAKPVASDFNLLTFQAFSTVVNGSGSVLVYDLHATGTNVVTLSPTLTTTIP